MAQPAAAPAQAPRAPVPQWVTPDKFNGGLDENWTAWLQKYNQIAAVNGWTPAQQAQYLGLALTGDAQLFYQAIPAATRNGPLAALVQALTARFAPPQRAELHRAEFKARRQRKDESLSAFCEAVRSAASRAYPAMAVGDRDMLARDQYLSGLDSRTMRIRCKELHPATLDEALQAALHQQAITQSEESDAPVLPTCAIAPTPVDTLTATMDKILARLDRLETSAAPPQIPQSTARQARPPITCYNCGRRGHISRECRSPRTRPSSGGWQSGNRGPQRS